MIARIEEIWEDVAAPPKIFDPAGRPAQVRAMIHPGAPLATAVRLRMHGTIRLGAWRTFQAEEVIHLRRGYLWKARVGRSISGFDSFVDGQEAVRWKMFGVVPVANASGPDVRRSAIGRWLLESIWLPTLLLPEEGALWDGSRVVLSRFGETTQLTLVTDDRGQLISLWGPRWGNFGGGPYRYLPFGCAVEERREFGGYTLPSRVRAGWNWATSGEAEGEFFRATLDDVQFR